MKIKHALKRVGSDTIMRYFLPKDVLELLRVVVGEDILVPSKLRSTVMQNVSHVEMLRNRTLRMALIASMRPEDKEALAIALGVKHEGVDLDEELSRVRLKKSSERERVLFEFFEEAVPIEDESRQVSDIETVGEKPMLHDYQRQARREIVRHLEGGRRRCLLHMPTGSGKTHVAVWVAAVCLLKSDSELVVWLANREELCEQAIDGFKTVWSMVGDREINAYRLFGDHSPDVVKETKDRQGGFIVASLQKMLSTERSQGLLPILGSRVAMVIMDEAHMALAPKYRYVLEQLVEYKNSTRLLGLSATPGRTWNDPEQDAVLAEFFDHKKVTLDVGGEDPIEYLTKRGYIARINHEQIDHQDRLDANDLKDLNDAEIPDSILEKLSHDTVRNYKVVSEIRKLVSSGHRRIIVFGTTVQNSRSISVVLSAAGYTSFHVDSDTPSAERKSIITQFKSNEDVPMMLCNYGVFTAGFDAPKTTAVVVARPTLSLVLFSQMMGRATRGPAVGGTPECTVVSVIDTNLPGFRSLVEAFNNWEDVW